MRTSIVSRNRITLYAPRLTVVPTPENYKAILDDAVLFIIP
jgi:hypothetical protein